MKKEYFVSYGKAYILTEEEEKELIRQREAVYQSVKKSLEKLGVGFSEEEDHV